MYLGGGRASSRVHKGRESTRMVCTNLSLQGVVMIGSSNNCISEKSPKVRRRLLLFLLNSHAVNSIKFAFLTLVFPPMLLEHAYLVAWMFSPDCRLCVWGISISALQLIGNCNFFVACFGYEHLQQSDQYVTLQKCFVHRSLVIHFFPTPAITTKRGTANRYEITNSRPPGPIIMISHSETGARKIFSGKKHSTSLQKVCCEFY
jgi:hypothetical protein